MNSKVHLMVLIRVQWQVRVLLVEVLVRVKISYHKHPGLLRAKRKWKHQDQANIAMKT